MTNELDLSYDYERDVLQATFQGFAEWAEDQGLIKKEDLLTLPFPQREEVIAEHWEDYVQDLQNAYIDSIENQRMKWA